jgi:hypothetical protein
MSTSKAQAVDIDNHAIGRDLSKKRVFEIRLALPGEDPTTFFIAADNSHQIDDWLAENEIDGDSTYDETTHSPEDVELTEVLPLQEEIDKEKEQQKLKKVVGMGFTRISRCEVYFGNEKVVFAEKNMYANGYHDGVFIKYTDDECKEVRKEEYIKSPYIRLVFMEEE